MLISYIRTSELYIFYIRKDLPMHKCIISTGSGPSIVPTRINT